MATNISNSIVTIMTFNHNHGFFEYLVYRAGDLEIIDKIAARDMNNDTVGVKTIEDHYFNVEA